MTKGRKVDDMINVWRASRIFYSSFVRVVPIMVDGVNMICIGQSRYTEGTGFGFITNIFKRVTEPLNNKVNEAICSRFLGRTFCG